MSIQKIQDQVSKMRGVITVVVNDGTRPSPYKYLAPLKTLLSGKVRFLFATGTHRKVSPEEELTILGKDFSREVVAQSNMCSDGTHVHIGTTSRGTEVEIHPWLLTDSVLAINTVEPHYFAGFTGGRKSFLPGSASRKTIVQNHFLACRPGAQVGKLSGNPVHEDMMEGAAFLAERTEIVMINGVSGSEDIFCGSYDTSFQEAVKIATSNCGVTVKEKYSSLEVRPGNSLETSLYQAMKAVFLWESAVQDGGTLVLAANCREGLGAPQMERILRDSSSSFVPPRCKEEYSLGDHATLRLQEIRNRISISFRTGIDMKQLGFAIPPDSCDTVIESAGFSFPVMKAGNN